MSGKWISARTYNEICASGLVTRMRRSVYRALYRMKAPSTASEIAATMTDSIGGRRGKGNIHARLGELECQGIVVRLRPRQCKVTGHRTTVWSVLAANPVAYRRPPSKAQVEIKRLKAKVNKLLRKLRELT